jgi:hypothetical protein
MSKKIDFQTLPFSATSKMQRYKEISDAIYRYLENMLMNEGANT